ncbi:MAG: sigma-54-dependent transcriptional regulator [bacterium]
MNESILIVDDEKSIRESLQEVLVDEGYRCKTAADGEDALTQVSEEQFDLVITDLQLPGMDGIEVIKRIRNVSSKTIIVMITAYASVDTAVKALKIGASDYLVKPLILDDLIFRIRQLLKFQALEIENQNLRAEVEQKYHFGNLIGESAEMKLVFGLIKKIAPTNSNVLLQGESGTGKELVARAIHYHSLRKSGRFLPVCCSAISEQLMESELFGHKKGAFTGALQNKDGYFKAANKGTLFLDEISEIPLHLQSKLLRAIQEKEVYAVGSSQAEKVDIRIIAASNRDLEEEVSRGNFREDLFYRLNVAEINLPPLRKRRNDIPLLVKHFIKIHNQELGKKITGVDEETMRWLMNNEWKGNIRELENMIERAMILTDDELISRQALPVLLKSQKQLREVEDELKCAMKIYERQHILKVIHKTGNHKRQAAKLLGISESSLYRKLEELQIPTDGQSM